ncbi:MAG TPA: Dabb family protein [Marinilabiliaceae bacterium]|nr:Dabb family protein [Marinilabiliaceae bacterium]
MIKHIVLFQFKEDPDVNARTKALKKIKKSLEALRGVVPELKYIEIGINENANEKYDLSLISEFESWEDLNAYVVHPEHQKVSATIRQTMEQRACVDYEF